MTKFLLSITVVLGMLSAAATSVQAVPVAQPAFEQAFHRRSEAMCPGTLKGPSGMSYYTFSTALSSKEAAEACASCHGGSLANVVSGDVQFLRENLESPSWIKAWNGDDYSGSCIAIQPNNMADPSVTIDGTCTLQIWPLCQSSSPTLQRRDEDLVIQFNNPEGNGRTMMVNGELVELPEQAPQDSIDMMPAPYGSKLSELAVPYLTQEQRAAIPEATVPEVKMPEMAMPDDIMPMPEAQVPELIKPEAEMPEVKAPEAEMPEVKAPEADIPEVKAPEAEIPEFKAPEAEISEVKAPEAEMPEVKAPETEIPEVKAPEAEMPEAKAPEAEMPEVKAPETEIPEAKAPEAEIPEAKAPETEMPEAKAPEAEIPEVKAPETEMPEAKAPEAEIPEVKAPETEIPEVKAPEAEIPEAKAPETEMPEAKAPEAEIPEVKAPQAEMPEAMPIAPEAVPMPVAPEMAVPDMNMPETQIPIVAPEAAVPAPKVAMPAPDIAMPAAVPNMAEMPEAQVPHTIGEEDVAVCDDSMPQSEKDKEMGEYNEEQSGTCKQNMAME